jgi:hypothetical protein
MKSWIAFLAGGFFALALVVTCGGRGSGGSVGAAEHMVWESFCTFRAVAFARRKVWNVLIRSRQGDHR